MTVVRLRSDSNESGYPLGQWQGLALKAAWTVRDVCVFAHSPNPNDNRYQILARAPLTGSVY